MSAARRTDRAAGASNRPGSVRRGRRGVTPTRSWQQVEPCLTCVAVSGARDLRGLLLLTLVLVLPAPAAAEPAPGVSGAVPTPGPAVGGSIATYDVVLTLGADGVLYVRETITYDFDQSGEQDRPAGAVPHREPGLRRAERAHQFVHRRAVPGPDDAVPARRADQRRRPAPRGPRTAGVRARVRGGTGLHPRAGHDELVWDAIGTAWNVPIGNDGGAGGGAGPAAARELPRGRPARRPGACATATAPMPWTSCRPCSPRTRA